MNEKKFNLVLGALLHDIGKVFHRAGISDDHIRGGAEWLKENTQLPEEVLRQVRYHHYHDIVHAGLEPDDLSFITYVADNISSKIDRKERINEPVYGRHRAMESVFNHLYGNNQNFTYPGVMLEDRHGIIYPTQEEKTFDSFLYRKVVEELRDKLKNMELSRDFLNSLLEMCEAYWSNIPSTTEGEKSGDISLYDHAKITAAIASCLYPLLSKNIKNDVINNAKELYNQDHFLYVHLDISGIQSFIYDIASEKALKNLRGRSFYLEILLEYICDELLERLEYSRANLLYLGGGHAYLLCENTEIAKKIIEDALAEVNRWFLDFFGASLFLAFGWTSCSANDLSDNPSGSYADIFSRMSEALSRHKRQRYKASDLKYLNETATGDGMRECRICLRDDFLDGDICSICTSTIKISEQLLKNDFFIVTDDPTGLPLPWTKTLSTCNEKELIKLLEADEVHRLYPKNKRYIGKNIATKLWIADYYSSTEFSELAQASEGIPRLGVLKADVDDLGLAFTSGFKQTGYESISRTSTLSRLLNLYFKNSINALLETPVKFIGKQLKQKRDATIVYSGGDDLFIVGAWDDLIGFSLDLEESFRKYTQETMHLSAGLGIFTHTFPISAMAQQTNWLESSAKSRDGKNSICLFSPEYTFSWKDFRENIIDGKLSFLQQHFGEAEGDRRFLYYLLHVIRNSSKLNLARLAYHMGRRSERSSKDLTDIHQTIMSWMSKKEDSHELELSIILHDYLQRERSINDEQRY